MNKKTPLAALISAILAGPTVAATHYSLDEVVVSATRTEQNIEDVSSSVAKVSREELDENMTSDLKETFKYTPGVNAQGSGRFGVSGINIRGMEDSRVKVMVDGIQQPTPYNPGASQQRKYSNTIEMDTLAAVEVNKGPSSSLYGSDALGGVVLFRTKNPSDVLKTDGDEFRVGIKSGYASVNEEFKNTLTLAGRKGKFESILMLTYAEGSEYKTHGDGADVIGTDRGAADPADTKMGNALAKLFYQANDDHRFGLTFEYYDYQYESYLASQEDYNISYPAFGLDLTYTDSSVEDNNTRMRVGFEHEWAVNRGFADDLTWKLAYQATESHSDNYDTRDGNYFGTVYDNNRRNRQRIANDDSVQFDLQANKLIETESHYHELTYGASFLYNDFSLNNTDYDLSNGTSSEGSTGLPNAKVSQWGVFVQDQAFLMDEKLVLSAGLRYDSFSTRPEANDEGYVDNDNDAFTGRVGVVYHVAPLFSPYAQISQGFKAPTVYDLYYSYDSAAIFYGNPDLEAERSLSYEIGLRGANDSFKYELSAFYNHYDDFITTAYIGEDASTGKDVYTMVNLDEVKIYGAEFSSLIVGPAGTYSRLSVAYADGEDINTGEALDSVAPLTGTIGLGYDNRQYNFGGLISYKMVAKKDEWAEEEHVDAPSYSLLDITAYYRPIEDLTVRAGLFNALNEKYWLYEDISDSDTELEDINTQAGRNWGVNVEYLF